MRRLTVAILVVFLPAASAARIPQERPLQADGIVRLLTDLENALTSGRVEDFRRITAPTLTADDAAARFERVTGGGLRSTAIVRERARRPDPNGVYEVIADVLVSRGREGRLATWQMTAQPARAASDRFELTSVNEIAAIGDLVKLSLDPTRQFQVHNLTITAPDLTLKMTSGSAFVAESDTGVTALVLRGSGEVHFTPSDPAEQGQMRLFVKRPAFIAPIDMAFIRVNPNEYTDKLTQPSLTPVKVDAEELERARQIFTDLSARTYNLDLRSLTPERWSLEPPYGSMVVELHSKTYGWLTYARSPNEPEDISFFERSRSKNIAAYASPARLAERGKFYSEDDDETYDVESYTLDVTFDPSRAWISGKTSIKLKTKVFATSSLTFRLAQSLAVSSVSSPTFGYLLSLRVVGQNSVLVSLPKLVPGGTEIVLDVVYSGRLEPQSLDREAISVEPQIQEPQGPPQGDSPILQPEPRFMYSNRVYWHPQAQVTDYATATMRLTIPSEYQIVASGVPEGSKLVPAEVSTRSTPKFMRTFEYRADQPYRYLACVISRFVLVGSAKVDVPALALGDGTSASQTGASVNIEVISTPRVTGRSKSLISRVGAVTSYYAKTIGEAPYPNFTLATLDDNLPGGHSPAFFAIFHQPLPTTPYSWSDDPVAFDNIYPLFFLAHEVAHQWWGQAVGWKNYHEQWLSEGLAQYFAALYAGIRIGP